YLHTAHEYVWWLAPTIGAYRGYTKETRTPHAPGTLRRIGQPYMTRKDERYQKRGKTHQLHPDGAQPRSVFTHGVGGVRGVKHPAVMARGLAHHLVCLTSKLGDLVLDPFVGSGTTLLVARAAGRRAVGIDIHEPYLVEAAERLAQQTLEAA
ncbi:MAG: DNA methyltransferase, partial [Thermoleophilaceae bacterium]